MSNIVDILILTVLYLFIGIIFYLIFLYLFDWAIFYHYQLGLSDEQEYYNISQHNQLTSFCFGLLWPISVPLFLILVLILIFINR